MRSEFTAADAAAANALKGIRVILSLSTDSKVTQAAIGVQANILELQPQMSAAQTKMQELVISAGELEAKLRTYEDWDKVKKNYEAVEILQGLLAYSLKPDANIGEPHHYICPRCYLHRKKSFLLRARITSSNYSCQECRFEMLLTRPERQSMARALGGSWSRGW